MTTGKELKEIVNSLNDTDIVCVGEENDVIGENDKEIIGIETRKCGFDSNNRYYKVLKVRPYKSNGAMKFYRKN